MTKRHLAALAPLAAVLVAASACNEGLSAPSQDAIVAGSAQPVQNLVTGIIAQDRIQGTRFAYLMYPETMARNSVRIDANEPRYINELIGVPIDPSDFIGGSGWTDGYQTIRAANQLLANPSLGSLSAGDKSATIGFVQTLKALDYLRIVQLRDSLGEVIQGSDPSAVDPLRVKSAVLAYTSAVLDSGYAALTAAGVSAAVPFTVPSGYKLNGDYSLTANLAKFNRGLKGEVEVMRGFDHQTPCSSCFASAIAAFNIALAGSSGTATDLAQGPYYQFNPSAPESFSNPLADNKIYLTTNFINSIQSGDLRASKFGKGSTPSSSVSGLQLTNRSSLTDPTIAANITRPLPIRRNADFYLLRAQAKAETGDLAGATADVNVVHTAEGGLPALPTFTSVAQARAGILYEMRYSLLFEGPFYLVALREYGALTRAYVTQPGMPTVSSDPSHTTDPLTTVIPIPANEAAARNGQITPQP